jgi:hypothetical protein
MMIDPFHRLKPVAIPEARYAGMIQPPLGGGRK